MTIHRYPATRTWQTWTCPPTRTWQTWLRRRSWQTWTTRRFLLPTRIWHSWRRHHLTWPTWNRSVSCTIVGKVGQGNIERGEDTPRWWNTRNKFNGRSKRPTEYINNLPSATTPPIADANGGHGHAGISVLEVSPPMAPIAGANGRHG